MREKYTCMIVDDESKAIELLADSLQDIYPDIEITGQYSFWKPALEALKKSPPDILFLDIAMPQKNGMALLDLLPSLSSEVIFVTAYSDHALEAFEHYAAGYILKPVKEVKLIKTVNKVLERIVHKKDAARIEKKATEKIGIANNNGLDYVDVNDIIYVEAVNRYAKVWCTHTSILSSYNIGRYIKILSAGIFFQVHRSFLINTRHVKRYERSGIVIMSNGKEIPVSKNVREDFMKLFTNIQVD